MTDAVPNDYQPARWLTGPNYTIRELQWLCERLDASNKQLRIVNRQLAEQLRKEHEN